MTNLYISAPPARNAVAPTPLYNSSGYSNIKWLNASICGYSDTLASKTWEARLANRTATQGAGVHAARQCPFVNAWAAETETTSPLGRAQLPASKVSQSKVGVLWSQHVFGKSSCEVRNIEISFKQHLVQNIFFMFLITNWFKPWNSRLAYRLF